MRIGSPGEGWDLVDKGIWDQAPMLLVDMDICR